VYEDERLVRLTISVEVWEKPDRCPGLTQLGIGISSKIMAGNVRRASGVLLDRCICELIEERILAIPRNHLAKLLVAVVREKTLPKLDQVIWGNRNGQT
jgi:hypothetical protein